MANPELGGGGDKRPHSPPMLRSPARTSQWQNSTRSQRSRYPVDAALKSRPPRAQNRVEKGGEEIWRGKWKVPAPSERKELDAVEVPYLQTALTFP